jgi:hypothetical protein
VHTTTNDGMDEFDELKEDSQQPLIPELQHTVNVGRYVQVCEVCAYKYPFSVPQHDIRFNY